MHMPYRGLYHYYKESETLHQRIVRFKAYKFNCNNVSLFFQVGNQKEIKEEPYTDDDFMKASGVVYQE